MQAVNSWRKISTLQFFLTAVANIAKAAWNTIQVGHALSEQTTPSQKSLDKPNFELSVKNNTNEIEMWFWKKFGLTPMSNKPCPDKAWSTCMAWESGGLNSAFPNWTTTQLTCAPAKGTLGEGSAWKQQFPPLSSSFLVAPCRCKGRVMVSLCVDTPPPLAFFFTELRRDTMLSSILVLIVTWRLVLFLQRKMKKKSLPLHFHSMPWKSVGFADWTSGWPATGPPKTMGKMSCVHEKIHIQVHSQNAFAEKRSWSVYVDLILLRQTLWSNNEITLFSGRESTQRCSDQSKASPVQTIVRSIIYPSLG